MTYTIGPSDDGNYVVIRVQGDITRKDCITWISEAHSLGRSLGLRHYLTDLRKARNTDSNAENYRLINTDLSRTPGIDLSARVAVVVSPGDDSHNFIEVMARSGGQDVTVFNSLELAKRFLLAGI